MADSSLMVKVGASLQPALSFASRMNPFPGKAMACLLPQRTEAPPNTPLSEIDSAIKELKASRNAWVGTSEKQRVALLDEVFSNLIANADQVAQRATEYKGTYGSGFGEEIATLLPIAFTLREYMDALAAEGTPTPLKVKQRPDGQMVAEVFPAGILGLLFPGFRGEVWMEPGKPATQGQLYRAKVRGEQTHGGVALVLGAGNQVSVGIGDVLHCLLARDEVVLFKASPVNGAYVGPFVEALFKPFVERGWIRVVYGGREVGEYVCTHPDITHIHLTGSADTFNAIVWGSPSEVKLPPAVPKNTKPVTAELGNVTPFIIVPSHPDQPWSDAELKYHAHNVASGLAQNSAHNCLAAELVVVSRSWGQRAAFMSALREVLAASPQRRPYYPGADAKYNKFRAKFPRARELGVACSQGGRSTLPWLLVEDLAPDAAATQEENWSGVLQEVALPCGSSDPAEFMAEVTRFVNDKVWGTLTACVIIHPGTQARCAQAFDAMVAALRYGAVAINVPPAVAYCTSSLTWGGFPGHTVHDVGSGIGFVNNTLMFDHPQKSVLFGPWLYAPKPIWRVDHYSLEKLAPLVMRFLQYLHHPVWSLYYLTLVVGAALCG